MTSLNSNSKENKVKKKDTRKLSVSEEQPPVLTPNSTTSNIGGGMFSFFSSRKASPGKSGAKEPIHVVGFELSSSDPGSAIETRKRSTTLDCVDTLPHHQEKQLNNSSNNTTTPSIVTTSPPIPIKPSLLSLDLNRRISTSSESLGGLLNSNSKLLDVNNNNQNNLIPTPINSTYLTSNSGGLTPKSMASSISSASSSVSTNSSLSSGATKITNANKSPSFMLPGTPQFIALSPSLFSPLQKGISGQQGFMDEYYEVDRDPKVIETQKYLEQSWKNILVPKQQHLAKRELKFLIRRGIPDDRRVVVWKIIMGFEEFQSSLEFENVKAALESVPKKFRNLPSFGGVVSPSDHYLNEDGIHAVKRILSVIGMHHPEIEYCPVIPDIVHLLLVFLSELDTYTMVNILIQQSKSDFYRYLNISNRECTLFVLTFDSLVEKHLPKLYKHMISLGITSCKSFCEEWFSRLFVSSIPFQSVIKVFDIYLNEGYKVLYRVALGMLMLHRRVLLKTNTADSFLSKLKHCNSQLIDTSELMKTAFGIHLKRGSLNSIDAQQTDKLKSISEPLLPIYYKPKVSSPSGILEEDHYEIIWAWLPHKYCICDPKIIFSSSVDGFNIRLLYEKIQGEYPIIITIKTNSGAIIGFFTDSEIKPGDGFGVADTFVFTIKPHASAYKATLKNELYVRASNSKLEIGGGSLGDSAISLSDDLNGTTHPSETFDNPQLDIQESFQAVVLEAMILQ